MGHCLHNYCIQISVVLFSLYTNSLSVCLSLSISLLCTSVSVTTTLQIFMYINRSTSQSYIFAFGQIRTFRPISVRNAHKTCFGRKTSFAQVLNRNQMKMYISLRGENRTYRIESRYTN